MQADFDPGKHQVSDAALQEMVSHIADPNIRKHFENVIGGVIQREVVCLNTKQKDGVVIGHYYQDGQLIEVKSETNEGTKKYPEMVEHGAISSRQRLDGHMGYACRCKNDSRLSEAEKGIISADMPTRDDLAIINKRLQDKPTEFIASGDSYQVDNFLVRSYGGTK